MALSPISCEKPSPRAVRERRLRLLLLGPEALVALLQGPDWMGEKIEWLPDDARFAGYHTLKSWCGTDPPIALLVASMEYEPVPLDQIPPEAPLVFRGNNGDG